jgi:hypothetical protein
MSIDLADYETKAGKAVKAFWKSRKTASKNQVKSGKSDQGERAGVTAGKNMNGFLSLMQDVVRKNGLEHAQICLNRKVLTLPGYFRPTKLWDLLVLNEGRLVATIELKSHVGPSFSNNFNHRTEEAIGTAHDLWTAYREGSFGKNPRPFVGWLILVEDCTCSRKPVRDRSAHFPVFKEFVGASYADRYNIFCQKLVQEQLYTSAAVILSSRTALKSGAYSELSEMTGLRSFIATLGGHVAAEAARSNPK